MIPAQIPNALSEAKRQQLVASGQLGWPLRRIEGATGVRRETASGYLKYNEVADVWDGRNVLERMENAHGVGAVGVLTKAKAACWDMGG